ncbi:RluA family pseudouridine synthase [bacterium]|nr:RluA family pseudouridine synthase [bacterium]MBT3903457.1 RluA family pseudouridine synthase [bacterium]MBT4577469.1 RluA family pseudouridine synthase [bacterium]MBT5346045.1 RluA family pseudouridine synthase [bacterium]MBT6130957.1 RluA family pseudouridine synthase [bacterium]
MTLVSPPIIEPGSTLTFIATPEHDLCRLDSFIAQHIPNHSRTFFKGLINGSYVTVNNQVVAKSSRPIKTDDKITVTFPVPPKKDISNLITDDLGIEIVADLEHFMIINKPAGLLVHPPSSKSTDITLSDWLVARFHELENVGYSDRPGIVHRLDRATSGIMVVPKNSWSHLQFGTMFRTRTIHKTYMALVRKHPERTGKIDYHITRHPAHKNRMMHSREEGRVSLTNYKVKEYLQNSTLVEAKPVSGRTHQIRVHFAAIGHALIGDPIYGSKSKFIKRQALHAQSISFELLGTTYEFSCSIPDDFEKLIERARTSDM